MRISSMVCAGAIGGLVAFPAAAAERRFDVQDFSGLNVSKGIEVTVTTGDGYSILAETSRRNLLRRLDISKKGDTLYISRESGWSFFMMGMTDSYHVTVTLPELTDLKVTSGAQVKAALAAPVEALDIHASSGADIDIDIAKANELNVKVSSGANVDASGACGAAEVRVSSGSEFDAKGLTCASGDLRASSGGDIALAVYETVSGRVSSGGEIRVYGDPNILELRESSGGDMRVSH